MRKILMAFTLCLISVALLATRRTYVRVDSALENYSGEYLIGVEVGKSFVCLNNYNKRVILPKQNDSTIVCDDSLSLNLFGTSQYAITSKDDLYLDAHHPSRANKFTSTYTVWQLIRKTDGKFLICYPYVTTSNTGNGGTAYWEYDITIGDFKISVNLYVPPYEMTNGYVTLYKLNDEIDATIHDTIYITLHDTIRTTEYVHDTLYKNNYFYDTIRTTQNHYIYLHDTLYVDKSVHDTIYETIYLEYDGTKLTYSLDDKGVTYFYGQILNMDGIDIKLYTSDGKFVERSNCSISMADKPKGIYIVTDGNGGYLKFMYK